MKYANNLPAHHKLVIEPGCQSQAAKDITVEDFLQPSVLQDGQFGIFTDLFQYTTIVDNGYPVYCIGVSSAAAEISFAPGEVYEVNAASVIILRPGDAMPSVERSGSLPGVYVFFTNTFLHALGEDNFSVPDSFLLGTAGPVIPLKDNEAVSIRTLFERIYQLITDLSTFPKERIARHLVICLLLETHSILSGYQRTGQLPDKSQHLLYHRFKQLVAMHAKYERGILFYACRLRVSQNYLYKIIKQVSAISPKVMVNEQIIAEAKKLLKQSCLSVSEIADSLNFPDLFVFSKFFKKQTGMSPSVYRKKSILMGLPIAFTGHSENVEMFQRS
ncbi:MAG: helix-turn-helix domain-containing protein [Chitinophagaceae bacterium]